jgi:hypothetical protein
MYHKNKCVNLYTWWNYQITFVFDIDREESGICNFQKEIKNGIISIFSKHIDEILYLLFCKANKICAVLLAIVE